MPRSRIHKVPTSILRPDSTLTGQFTILAGLGTHHSIVSDASDDTYLGSDIVGNREEYTFSNLPAEAATVQSINAVISARRETPSPNANTVTVYWKLGADQMSSNVSMTLSSFSVFSIGGIARPGGGSWSVADANALVGGFQVLFVQAPYGDVNESIEVADMWFEVVWSPAAPPPVAYVSALISVPLATGLVAALSLSGSALCGIPLTASTSNSYLSTVESQLAAISDVKSSTAVPF